VLPIFVAVVAAILFALGNAIQHKAASSVSVEGSVGGFFGSLFVSPLWLAGSAIALSAWGLHITAMNLGAVAVVQPMLLLGVLLAVPIRAVMDRTLPSVPEVMWVSITLAAVVVFVAVSDAKESPRPPHDTVALMITLVGVGVPLASTWWVSHRPAFPAGGTVLALAAGLMFGCASGLMKFIDHDSGALLTHWHIYALLVASVGGTMLNQQAYQRSSVSVVLPSSNCVSVTVAVAIGWAVFHEQPAPDALAFTAQLACLAVMVIGLLQVARQEEKASA
jgi:hypothetical protein